MNRINSDANLEIQNNRIFSRSSNDFYKKNEENKMDKKRKYSPCEIEEPKGGIPSDWIKSNKNIPSSLNCVMCLNLLWNPYELEECHHIFCKYCISKWINKKKICPTCKQIPKTIKPSITIERVCGEIEIKCLNNGCNQFVSYSNYIEHLQKCQYRKYRCTNEGCGTVAIKKDVKKHSLNCKYRLEECPYCKNLVQFYKLEEHQNTVCTQEYQCPKCLSSMTRGEYFSEHKNENDENIQCLKAQVNLYKCKCKNLNDKYNGDMEKQKKKEKKIVSLSDEKIKNYDIKLKINSLKIN